MSHAICALPSLSCSLRGPATRQRYTADWRPATGGFAHSSFSLYDLAITRLVSIICNTFVAYPIDSTDYVGRGEGVRRVAHNCLPLAIVGIVALALCIAAPSLLAQTVSIDANAPGTPFPHFWEQ